MQDITSDTWLQDIKANWLPLLVEHGSHIIFALLTLAVGWWLINRITKGFVSFLKNRHADAMVIGFLSSLTLTLLRIMLLLSVAERSEERRVGKECRSRFNWYCRSSCWSSTTRQPG